MSTANRLTRFVTTLAAVATVAVAVAPGSGVAATYVARNGHVENADQPRHIMLEKVAERVKARTNGEVEFQIFPSSQLGGQRAMSEGVKPGSLEGHVSATSWMAGLNPLVTLIDMTSFSTVVPDQAMALHTGACCDRLPEPSAGKRG